MVREVEKDVLENFDINESSSPFRKYIAYYMDNLIVGYLSFDVIYDRVEIVNLFCLENYRRGGVGFGLLTYLVNYAKKNSCYNITLEVNSLNIGAINLYEKIGFVKKAVRKGYYKGTNGILMEFRL